MATILFDIINANDDENTKNNLNLVSPFSENLFSHTAKSIQYQMTVPRFHYVEH